MPYKDPEKRREHKRAWCAANRERVRGYGRKYHAKNLEKDRERCRRHRASNLEKARARGREYSRTHAEERREYLREYGRRKYQRMGRGIYAARIQDWRDFFDGLANDVERRTAGHVLLALADFDSGTRAVVYDASFDYAYIAPHFDI